MGALDTATTAAVSVARLAARQAGRIGTTLLATDGRDVLMNDPDGWEVEQPWLWWMGPANGNGTGGPLGNPIPGSDAAWTQATGIPAVGRATSLVVDTLAALPWRVHRGQERLTTPDWMTDPQALRLDGRVVNPGDVGAARWSAMDVWSQWITSALWFGDGYLWVPSRDQAGQPRAPLYVLAPSLVRIEDGRYWVDIDGMEARELRPDEVIHLRGLEPISRQHGSGALTRYGLALNAVRDLRQYMASVFSAGVPAGYLKANQPRLDPDQAQALKASWMQAHGNASRSIAVLNATTEFHPLTFKPVDADLVAMLNWSLVDIANAFGVPAYMLGAQGDGNTYANVESRMIEFVRFTLQPWAARIEAVLDAQFPRGTSVKIALDALMRADTVTRYAAYKTAREAGWLTVDEIRALEDLPPMAEVTPDAAPLEPPVEVSNV